MMIHFKVLYDDNCPPVHKHQIICRSGKSFNVTDGYFQIFILEANKDIKLNKINISNRTIDRIIKLKRPSHVEYLSRQSADHMRNNNSPVKNIHEPNLI